MWPVVLSSLFFFFSFPASLVCVYVAWGMLAGKNPDKPGLLEFTCLLPSCCLLPSLNS